MKVKIKKIHESWSILYPNEIKVGYVVDLNGHTITTKSGIDFSADEMCKAFSNHCSYMDIFEKIEL